MLTYNGSLTFVLIHAALWFGSFCITLGQRHDIFTWLDAQAVTETNGYGYSTVKIKGCKDIYIGYMLCTVIAPALLVVYELFAMVYGRYVYRVPIQGFIFATGFLSLALGTISIQYAFYAPDASNEWFLLGYILAASGVGMFATFHAEFVAHTVKEHEKDGILDETKV
jgi:hypothetical protein